MFHVGDAVRLKSGGPVLLVELVYLDDVQCSWFSAGVEKRHTFPQACLKRAARPPLN